jgi:hypothetical protein
MLFVGWWTDAGRLMTTRRLDPDGPALTACLLTVPAAARRRLRRGCCGPAPPLGTLASWGMCALGAPSGTGRGMRVAADPVCALSDGE